MIVGVPVDTRGSSPANGRTPAPGTSEVGDRVGGPVRWGGGPRRPAPPDGGERGGGVRPGGQHGLDLLCWKEWGRRDCRARATFGVCRVVCGVRVGPKALEAFGLSDDLVWPKKGGGQAGKGQSCTQWAPTPAMEATSPRSAAALARKK